MSNVENFYRANERHVKSLMAAQGLTFASLTERIKQLTRAEYSLSAIHHAVTGRRSGSTILPFIASALGVSLDSILLSPPEPKPQLTETEAA